MGIFSLFFSLAKHSLKYDFLLLWVLHTHHGTWDAENFVKQTHPRLHQFYSVYFENKLKSTANQHLILILQAHVFLESSPP